MSAQIETYVSEVTVDDQITGCVDVIVPYFDYDDEPTDDIEYRVTVTTNGIQLAHYKEDDDEDDVVELTWAQLLAAGGIS